MSALLKNGVAEGVGSDPHDTNRSSEIRISQIFILNFQIILDDDASGSEWEEADEYTVKYVKSGKPKSTAKYVKTGKPRGRKPKLNSAGGKYTIKHMYLLFQTFCNLY